MSTSTSTPEQMLVLDFSLWNVAFCISPNRRLLSSLCCIARIQVGWCSVSWAITSRLGFSCVQCTGRWAHPLSWSALRVVNSTVHYSCSGFIRIHVNLFFLSIIYIGMCVEWMRCYRACFRPMPCRQADMVGKLLHRYTAKTCCYLRVAHH